MSIIDNALQALFNWSRRTQVWANSSPESAFPEQMISCDLSDAEFVEIRYRYGTADDTEWMEKVKIGKDTILLTQFNIHTPTGSLGARRRSAQTSNTAISFGTSFTKTANKTSPTEADNYLIPTVIYKLGGAIANLLRRLFSGERRCAVWQ